MSSADLLQELEAGGVHLSRDGDDLIADMRRGASLEPFRERIIANKPALLAELLKAEIIAAVTVAPADFDRAAYLRLMEHWYGLEAVLAADND
jgi:hypothetical protein